jgi:hypothetical protein
MGSASTSSICGCHGTLDGSPELRQAVKPAKNVGGSMTRPVGQDRANHRKECLGVRLRKRLESRESLGDPGAIVEKLARFVERPHFDALEINPHRLEAGARARETLSLESIAESEILIARNSHTHAPQRRRAR